MPFLDGVTELSEDERSVLPAADMLDDCLARLIMSACPGLDKSIAEKVQPYQVISSFVFCFFLLIIIIVSIPVVVVVIISCRCCYSHHDHPSVSVFFVVLRLHF